MTDAFALFKLPRSPCVPDLKDDFHRRSAVLHPDAGGDAARFGELNTAYRTLSDPAARLRHLLELEGLPQTNTVPPALGEHFMQSAGVRQGAEKYLAQLRAAGSPLARAVLAADRAVHIQRIDAALAVLDTAHAAALASLRDLAASWRDDPARLAELHATFSYLSRWQAQLRETRLQFDLLS